MKTFVLDTNVLLHDPACLQVFGNNEVVIPLSILDELDNLKIRLDGVGRNARAVVRKLDELRSHGSLEEGVRFKNSIIRVELNHQRFVPDGLDGNRVDNKIISVALGLEEDQTNEETKRKIIVVTKDINLRVKCDALGIAVEDYNKDKIDVNPESIYSGVIQLSVPSQIINDIYNDQEVDLGIKLFPNQFAILQANENPSQSVIVRQGKNALRKVREYKDGLATVFPRNAEQRMAVDLLLNPDIQLVTLIGKAGSGKTLLSVAAAFEDVVFNKNKNYSRILISRPIQPMGKDLGYLPGGVEEKLSPWMQPLYDNIEYILGGDQHMVSMYQDQGLLQVEPLTYIRGRSIPKSIILLDEAQNISANEIKTVITRLGEGSKIIVTGDIEQIDNPYIDHSDNGLTHVIERFKDHPIAGHITLQKGERSELATLASQRL